MYILEWILKKIFPAKLDSTYDYDPLAQPSDDREDEECNHEFMPVDSTGEVLACIKCGFIVKRKSESVEDEQI